MGCIVRTDANALKRGLPPMHRGELLREDVPPAVGKSKTEIARLLGISRQLLSDIPAERAPVRPPTAPRLGKLCGNDPNLGSIFRRSTIFVKLNQSIGDALAAIPTLNEAA